jgi:hypothetical protein
VELTEGKHYWEVELLSEEVDESVDSICIGISRPNLDPTGGYYYGDCADGWFMSAYNGTLYGNGKDSHAVALSGAWLLSCLV